MIKADVVKFRDEACAGCKDIVVVCDNMIIFSTNTSFVVWDDDNERVYSIRANTGQYTQDGVPMEILCTSYENIQYIKGYTTTANLKNVLQDTFVGGGLIDNEKLDKIIEYANKVTGKLL